MTAKSIICSNPSCGQTINYAGGESIVICPACGTLHMPDKEVDEYNPVPKDITPDQDQDAYRFPPINDRHTPPPEENYNTPADLSSSEGVDYEPFNDFVPDSPSEDPIESTNLPPQHYQPQADNSYQPPEVENEQTAIAHLQTSTGERLILKAGKNTIGRQGTDLIINDRTVSRQHCIVEVIENENEKQWMYIVYDYGHEYGKRSGNGVLTSHRSIRLEDHERVRIYPNQSIQLGKVSLLLCDS